MVKSALTELFARPGPAHALHGGRECELKLCLQRRNTFENYVKIFSPRLADGSPPPSEKYLFCLGPCEEESDGRNKCLRNLGICLNGN